MLNVRREDRGARVLVLPAGSSNTERSGLDLACPIWSSQLNHQVLSA